MAEVRVTAVVVPEIFAPYVRTLTEQKTALIDSGVVVRDPALDGLLAGGGRAGNDSGSTNPLRTISRIALSTAGSVSNGV